jgi:oligosaccharide repeat unit polymerase
MRRSPDIAGIWWLKPSRITLIWMAVLLVSMLTSADAYAEIARTRKYIDWGTTSVLMLGLAAFWLGCVLFERSAPTHRALSVYAWLADDRSVLWLSTLLLAATVMAYLIWLGPALNPATLIAILTAEFGSEYGRKVTSQIAGLTTLTELGMPLAVLATLRCLRGRVRERAFWLGIIGVLFVLAALRALIWSERIAVIEVAIPAATTLILFTYRGQRWFGYIPVVALALLVGIFAAFEYFRSWTFFSAWGENYLAFAVGRLFSYYSTSFNNGAAYMQLVPPSYVPVNFARFIFEFPNPFSDGLRQYAAAYDDQLATFFTDYLNPEFNLLSGPGAVIADFGPYLGCFGLFLLGGIAGALYASYVRLGIAGLVLYPVWLVGLLDFGRTLYWPQGRVIPAVLAAAIIMLLYRASSAGTRSIVLHVESLPDHTPVQPVEI